MVTREYSPDTAMQEITKGIDTMTVGSRLWQATLRGTSNGISYEAKTFVPGMTKQDAEKYVTERRVFKYPSSALNVSYLENPIVIIEPVNVHGHRVTQLEKVLYD